MIYASLTRDEFIGWLAGKHTPQPARFSVRRKIKTSDRKITIVWQDSNTESGRPPIVAVAQNDLQDFFAFVSTYVSTFKPFSAFFNVVPIEALELVIRSGTDQTWRSERFARFVGVAIAETHAQSRSKTRSLDRLSVQGVRATLSATLMRAIFQGYEAKNLAMVAERWEAARRLTSDNALSITPNNILQVWQVIGNAVTANNGSAPKRSKGQLDSILGAGFEEGAAFDEWFLPLIESSLGSDKYVKVLKGSREERVKSIPAFFEGILTAKISPDLKDFLVGGLLSMVGNGSMAHLPLTDQVVQDMPRAVLWFGALSALQPQNDSLTASNCLGRRLARDLMKEYNPFSVPDHDVSLEELQVLGEKAWNGFGMRTMHSGTIEIGLVGTVHTPFRSINNKQEDERQRLLNERRRSEAFAGERIHELRMLLDRASRITKEISHSRQRDFFEND
ncbi:hypothetical protein [Labrenzia sp. CE80]|uniref:hypothetical protein n=1 Tax=Labrenzia sp. CE80 TaxID=1788986 RepID=UPI00129AE69D|nr:hypothetical protein [Labrenzia sp. CE80]